MKKVFGKREVKLDLSPLPYMKKASSKVGFFAPSAGLPSPALRIDFWPSPKRKKPTTFVAGFGSLCWARTSDPLINSQML